MKKETLFDQIFNSSEEKLNKIKKPVIKSQLKRKLKAFYDDSLNKKSEASLSIIDTRNNLENFDVNLILEKKLLIERLDKLSKLIQEEYFELFNEKLDV